MGTIIGIDLGTTNSACAIIERGEPRIVISQEGGRVTPSVVGFNKEGERFVGDVAKRQMLIHPELTVYGIKRFMGRRFRDVSAEIERASFPVTEALNGDCSVEILGRPYRPEELSAMILQRIRQSAADFLGEEVTEAVITVPAYFTDRQRQATRDAGAIAGLDVLRVINEPTAAALAYVHERKRASNIAVYDFGGGTFDISLLHVDRDVAEVLATQGNSALGGTDIDERVVGWLIEQFQAEHGTEIGQDRVVLQRLREAAERAKLELSNVRSTDIHLPFLLADASGPKHLQTTLDRATFESLTEDLFQQTIRQCEQALAQSGLRADQLDEVIMVGGSSRIPRVQALVRDLFKRPLNKGFNPDEVVAIGAAIQSGILEGEVKSVTLLDVTNFSLGIEVAGGRFATLIPKNTTIPAQQKQMVSTVVDNQRTVKIHVLQGESPDARSNVSLGTFELHNVQAAPRGVPRIRVRFSIDASGIVHVEARDQRTGITEAITIDAPSGLKTAEIQRLREQTQEPPTETPEQKELRGLREEIERQVVALEGILREHRGTLHRSEHTDIEHAIKRGRMALLKSSDAVNLRNLTLYLGRIRSHVSARMPR